MDATFCRMGCGADMRRLNIDPCWLREQYCGNFRTFADIAAEIGCSHI
jgi:hypothetical protein